MNFANMSINSDMFRCWSIFSRRKLNLVVVNGHNVSSIKFIVKLNCSIRWVYYDNFGRRLRCVTNTITALSYSYLSTSAG